VSEQAAVPLAEQSFTASTADGAVFVRVAVRGEVLGLQLEPAAMQMPGHHLAERIVACADAAYLQGQVAIRTEWERAQMGPETLAGMPTQHDLTAAQQRLGKL
jgi:DNA-binding protein YbaB